ncbi:MAG: response regulator [Desulfobacteraceae bacterium]|nr:response regulator [Desulfobacteraceae bacterium]
MTAKHQILVVDDSRMMRSIIRGYLSEFDCDIVEASDGAMAEYLVKKSHFDLIITDVSMPVKTGFELCRDLKNDPATCGIPILIISSFDSEEDIHTGFQAGASDYLSKEALSDHLFNKVEEILSKSAFNASKQIMIVDDSSLVRHLVEAGLSKEGYRIITAYNGMDAMEKLDNLQPDLIISDIDMPVMNGFEFCEAVQADAGLKTIPFIVMSTNSDRGHMQRMLQRGAQAYLVKPFNLDQLSILVDKLLADHFVMLLKDRERLESERRMMLSSITSLVHALEARDPYTKGHSLAVARIASAMAKLSGAGKEEVQSVMIGGHLHDIGKIGISDSVLLKPDCLNSDEYATIKEHPIIGANILSPIESLKDIIPMVRCHHERIDGKGYPMGLKGSQIPLWARITSVADTFHALTSNRPYKTGVKAENALQIIEEAKGTQLCPECVDLFIEWISTDDANKIFMDETARFKSHMMLAE